MIHSLIWATLLVLQVQNPPPIYKLEELAEAHDSALNLIHQIEFVMEHRGQEYKNGKPFGKPSMVHSWRWARQGESERLRYMITSPPRKEGRPEGIYDWFMDKSTVRLLRNWDPKNPQTITPTVQGTVRAVIEPRTDVPPANRDVFRQMLWGFSIDGDDRRSLSKLVRDSPHAELIGPTEVDGHRVLLVRAVHPGMKGEPRPDVYFDVYLDLTMNFAARRVIEHISKVKQQIDNKQENFPLDVIRTVKKFQDFGEGIFVPVEIETHLKAGSSDSRESSTLTTIKDLVVNAPLSPDALDFRFPEHVLVIYSPPVSPTEQRVELWGPNNRAIKEINKPEDIPGFEDSKKAATAAPVNHVNHSGNFSRGWFLFGNVFLIGCIILLFRYYRAK